MDKMTLHRALSELKLIDQRIDKAISDVQASGIMQKDKKVNGIYDKAEFEADAKSRLQSVVDLIERRNKIKSAVVLKNALTFLEVAGKSMTIADAITAKSTIKAREVLIKTLRERHKKHVMMMEQNNAKVDANAIELAKVSLSKQNVKITDDDVQKVTEPYFENNRFHLVDPLDIEKLTAKMEDELRAFESEVDACLSEINAITYIEF